MIVSQAWFMKSDDIKIFQEKENSNLLFTLGIRETTWKIILGSQKARHLLDVSWIKQQQKPELTKQILPNIVSHWWLEDFKDIHLVEPCGYLHSFMYVLCCSCWSCFHGQTLPLTDSSYRRWKDWRLTSQAAIK